MNKPLLAMTLMVLSIQGFSKNKVIYGKDDRVLVAETQNALYKKLAISTAAQIKAKDLSLSEDKSQYSITGKTLRETMEVCEDERFSDVINVGNCSGFLVADDLLVTAGHCMRSESDCSTWKWVFSYRQDRLGDEPTVEAKDVYGCKEIVNQKLSSVSKNDFAIVRLDRKVEGREPLKFRTEGKIALETELVVIGHPSGLPTIVADGAKVRENENEWFFQANLDTFGGNSGSGVFDAKTGVVEGILVRGEKDYEFDKENSCYRVFECEDDSCRGEDVTRITVIPELVPGMTPVEPEEPDMSEFDWDGFPFPIDGFEGFDELEEL